MKLASNCITYENSGKMAGGDSAVLFSVSELGGFRRGVFFFSVAFVLFDFSLAYSQGRQGVGKKTNSKRRWIYPPSLATVWDGKAVLDTLTAWCWGGASGRPPANYIFERKDLGKIV